LDYLFCYDFLIITKVYYSNHLNLDMMSKRDLVNELKPFWKKRRKLETKFREAELKIEEEMTKKLNVGIDLEFFFCDEGCVGIGASDFSERKRFPLIHDSELD